MTLIVTQERVSGSLSDITAPYYVHDDAQAEVDAETATAAAVSQFNTDFSLAVTDYPYVQLAKHAWRVTCKYRPQRLRRRTPESQGSATWRFSYSEPGFYFLRSRDTIETYPSTNAPDFAYYLNVRQTIDGSEPEGYQAPPPAPTDIVELVLPNAQFTAAYRKTIMDLRGCVNSVPIFDRPVGTMRFCSAQSVKRNDDDLVLSLGFEYKPSGPDIGNLFDSVDGHDYVWYYTKRETHAGSGATPPYVGTVLVSGYVERLYPRKNLMPLLVIPGV